MDAYICLDGRKRHLTASCIFKISNLDSLKIFRYIFADGDYTTHGQYKYYCKVRTVSSSLLKIIRNWTIASVELDQVGTSLLLSLGHYHRSSAFIFSDQWPVLGWAACQCTFTQDWSDKHWEHLYFIIFRDLDEYPDQGWPSNCCSLLNFSILPSHHNLIDVLS